jgi:hypothetical protein
MRRTYVPPSGNPQAKMAVCGEQPAFQEVRYRKPFVGPAGHGLDDCLTISKITRHSLYLTNVIKDIDKPIQFRAALFKEWIGKGTLAYNPHLDTSGFDLAIPLSSLKGNKPVLGNHQGKILMGLVFDGEVRRAKPG